MDKKLIDFQKDWEKLVSRALTNYNLLTPEERVWYNVQILIGAVDNGGLFSYYIDSGVEHVFETIEDLDTLEHSDIARMLEEINKFFLSKEILMDFDKRNEIIPEWKEDSKEVVQIEKFEKQFYEQERNLEKSLVEYILKNNLSAPNRYIIVKWTHKSKEDPVFIYSEIGKDLFETRKVEMFSDGSWGYADKNSSSKNTELGDQIVPSFEEINARPEFELVEISKEEFEQIWSKAHLSRNILKQLWPLWALIGVTLIKIVAHYMR